MKNGARSRADSRPLTRIERGLEEPSSLWGRLLGQPLLWALVAVALCSRC
jgi:hypothetical protein